MNGRIVYACEYKRLLTNCLHGKAAEWAVLTEIIIIIIKLALQHAHIKLRIMTYACTIKLCMLEGMLASSASTLKVYMFIKVD